MSNAAMPPLRQPTAEEITAGANPGTLIDDGIPLLQVKRAVSQLNNGEGWSGADRWMSYKFHEPMTWLPAERISLA